MPWAEHRCGAARLLGTGAKALLTAFTSLPPWVQTAVLTGWGLNKLTGGALGNIAGTLTKAAFGSIRGGTPATPVYTKEVGIPGTAAHDRRWWAVHRRAGLRRPDWGSRGGRPGAG